jgi:hypothetical protein
MVVKATLAELRIAEVPTTLAPDGRSRPPHLRSWRDGWRHLRFLLMMSPRWLLLYPGIALIVVGVAAQLAILRGTVVIRGIGFDVHTMIFAAGFSILGLQLVVFALFARAIGCLKGVLPMTAWFARVLDAFTLERGIILGMAILASGIGLAVYSVELWVSQGLSRLDPAQMMRIAIPSVGLMLAGAEITFASFVLSFIDVRQVPGVPPASPQ